MPAFDAELVDVRAEASEIRRPLVPGARSSRHPAASSEIGPLHTACNSLQKAYGLTVAATIYARVDSELKAATDDFAADHGMSLASAVGDLLGRGLAAASDEVAIDRLEWRIRELETELARVRDAATTLQGRLDQVLGSCECGEPVTGHALLVTGKCPKCSRGVTRLLTDTGTSGGTVDRNEFGPFLAGVGVAVALVMLAYATSG